MKTFEIDDPVFKTAPLFIVGCSHVDLDAYLRTYRVTAGLDTGQVGQLFTFTDPPWRVVWARDLPTDATTLSVFIHEVFHLVTRLCQDRGIPIKAQIEEGFGDETAAYLLDYFMREAIQKLGLCISQRSRRAR